MGQKRLDCFVVQTESSTAKKVKATGAAHIYTSAEDVNIGKRRAESNKNHALAKKAVIACEREGAVPYLKDLLIEASWKAELESEFDKSYFKSLETFVREQWVGGKLVFPPKDCLFRAYNAVPLRHVKVVILGQDPYHDLGQAQGLSFSVPTGKQLPSSLRNIYKEITEDIGCPMSKQNGCLEPWSHQGVLL